MRLTVNGRKVEVEGPLSVTAYLEHIGANPSAVAVELDGEILDRADYATRSLAEGAEMEIVRMVGGG